MIKNVIATIDFICKKYNMSCDISNAEHYFLTFDDEDVSHTQDKFKLDKFERICPWGSIPLAESEDYEDFLEYYAHRISWKTISRMNLSKEFMERNKDKLDWIEISRNQELTEMLMEVFKGSLNWKLASFNQKMTEEFIEKYSDKVDWQNISMTKKLSKEFILKYEDKLDMRYVNMKNKDFINQVKNLY